VLSVIETVGSYFPSAIAITDLATGEGLACHEIQMAAGVEVSRPLVFSSALGRYWLVSQTRPYGGGGDPNAEFTFNIQSQSFDDEKFSQSRPIGSSSWGMGIALSGDGQLLGSFDRQHLLSFDTLTGELLWVKTPGQLADAPGQWAMGGVLTIGPGEVGVILGRMEVQGGVEKQVETALFRLDGCGQAERIYEANPIGLTMRINNRLVVGARLEDGAWGVKVLDENQNVLHAEPRCSNYVEVAPQRIACVRAEAEGKFRVISFNLDGSDRRFFLLPQNPEFEYLAYNTFWGTAGANNTLIVGSAENIDHSLPYTNSFHILSLDTEAISGSLELIGGVGPDGEHRHPSGAPPLLSSTGILIIPSNGGALHAYQTNVPGLARTNFPRGPLGGNENRGYVALPEEF
ncbi:MAG: hypothetical protein ACNA8W_02245, partial [Bradymonadaceae bacterium]